MLEETSRLFVCQGNGRERQEADTLDREERRPPDGTSIPATEDYDGN